MSINYLKHKIINREDISLSDIPFISDEEYASNYRNKDFIVPQNKERLMLMALLTGRTKLLKDLSETFEFAPNEKIFSTTPGISNQYRGEEENCYNYKNFNNYDVEELKLLSNYVTFNSGYHPYIGLRPMAAAPLYEKGENYSLVDVNNWMHSKLQKIIGRKMSDVEDWINMNGEDEDEFGFESFGGIEPLDGKKKKKSIKKKKSKKSINKKSKKISSIKKN
jgi:hypothetical protein